MPLCRPQPAQPGGLWKTLKESPQCLFQKRTFLWSTTWRVVSRSPCFVVASAESLSALERDWEFIQDTVVRTRLAEFSLAGPWTPSAAGDGSPAEDPRSSVPLLLSYLSVHWMKESFSSSVTRGALPEQPRSPAPTPPVAAAAPLAAVTVVPPQPESEAPRPPPPPPTPQKSPRPSVSPVASPCVGERKERCETDLAIKEAKELEEHRTAFLRDVEPILAEARKEARDLHLKHVERIVGRLRNSPIGRSNRELAEEMARKMKEQEEKAISVHLSVLYSVDSSASAKVLDLEVQNKKRASELKAKVITVQRYWRGYRARLNYRRMVRALFQRDNVAHELLDTERTYLGHLQLMVAHFLTPLKTMTSAANMFIMPPEDLSVMFSNAELLIPVHKELLSQLDERMARWDRNTTEIGDVYLRLAPFLKMYKQYVSSFDKATAMLSRYMDNAEFQRWHNNICGNPELKKLRLNAFLIMPVQRIPRYALMLKEMVNNTQATHPDFKNLSKSLELISQVANDINEAKRRAEGQQRMVELAESLRDSLPNLVQPHRTFVCEAVAMLRKQKLDNGEEIINQQKPCFIVLLSDLFLVSQRRNAAMSLLEGGMVLLDSLPLARGSVFKISDLISNNKWKYGFELKTPLKGVDIYMEDEKERDKWFGLITELTEQLKKNLRSLVLSKEALANLQLCDGGTASQQQVGPARRLKGASTLGSMEKRQKLREVAETYKEIVSLQAELVSLPIDVKTLLPKLAVTLAPDALMRLKPRIDLLQLRLLTFDGFNERVSTLVKQYVANCASCDVLVMLDKSIMDGLDFISGIKNWLVVSKQHIQQQSSPRPSGRGSDVQSPHLVSTPISNLGEVELQVRYLMQWYINLCQTWELFTEVDIPAS